MDMFIEKIVRKRKGPVDVLLMLLIIIGTIAVSFLALYFLPSLATIIIIGLLYLAYILLSKLNVEYEYAVTNGDFDIDMIINQRKRKRMFSANCKDFEVVAKVNSSQYTREIQQCKNVKDYSSHSKTAEVWFISMRTEGKQTVILFEPLPQMIVNFRTFIPRKIFKD